MCHINLKEKMWHNINCESWSMSDLFDVIKESEELKNKFFEIEESLRKAEDCLRGKKRG